MKVKVRIDDRWYEVEIADLNERPVKASVDGEIFEVWPEEDPSNGKSNPPAKPEHLKAKARPTTPGIKRASLSTIPQSHPVGTKEGSLNFLRAPIPGVVISISVQPQDEVALGQELCVLEAMKMKNSIRSSRAGKIESINVSVGQHVKHHEVLFEFAA